MVAITLLVLTGCGGTEASTGVAIEQKSFPLVIQKSDSESPTESEMSLYYIDGGDVPYVAVSEYLPVFGELYEHERLGTSALEFDIKENGDTIRATRSDNGWDMSLDAQKDVISFTDYNGFLQIPNTSMLIPLVSIGEVDLDATSNILQDTGQSYNRQGQHTDFDLSPYHIDIVRKDSECYVPLQTMNDILLSRNYYCTVFNGEKVFIFATGSGLEDQIQSVPAGKMSESFAAYNFNELIFNLDTFYGLKPEHGIDDFYSLVTNAGLYEKLSGTDPEQFDEGMRELVERYLDDGHSTYSYDSYLRGSSDGEEDEDEGGESDQLGVSTSSYEDIYTTFTGHRNRYYPDLIDGDEHPYGACQYEELGDTAIVTFDQFTVSKNDYYKEANLDEPEDSIELIAYAHKQITRKGSPIKNVVLDLSCNVGGSGGSAAFVISWFTGGRQIGLRDTITDAQSVCLYAGDVNLDGEYSEDDSLAPLVDDGQINLYCLTSPLSFSCGNLVPSALKGSGVTLIGQTTGGGSCVVLPCTAACGTQFNISGPAQVSTIKNGSFYNADAGINPDVPITRLETYFDRQQLVEFIHELK